MSEEGDHYKSQISNESQKKKRHTLSAH